MSEEPVNEIPVAQPVPVLGLPLRAATPQVTYVLIGVTVAFYLLQQMSIFLFGYAPFGMDWLEYFGARVNAAILSGQFWRLLTPLLLHGSVLHIAFNMYALLSFGSFLEPLLGHWRFLLLYILAGLSGNVFSFLFSRGYSIGASTAVFGLVMAEGIFLYRNRQLLGREAQRSIGNIVFILGVNLLLGLSPGIDNWGHLGGLLGGMMFAWFSAPRYRVASADPCGTFVRVEDEIGAWHVGFGAALVLIVSFLLLLVKFL